MKSCHHIEKHISRPGYSFGGNFLIYKLSFLNNYSLISIILGEVSNSLCSEEVVHFIKMCTQLFIVLLYYSFDMWASIVIFHVIENIVNVFTLIFYSVSSSFCIVPFTYYFLINLSSSFLSTLHLYPTCYELYIESLIVINMCFSILTSTFIHSTD